MTYALTLHESQGTVFHPRRIPIALLLAFAFVTGVPILLQESGQAFTTGCFLALLIGFFGGQYLMTWAMK